MIADLPASYLEWFKRKGFSEVNPGTLLETICQIKVNGLEYLLKPRKIKKHEKTLTILLMRAYRWGLVTKSDQ